jgi:hypothetical protein
MLEVLLRRAFRTATGRGLSGSRAWATVAVVVGAVRLLRRITTPKPDVVWRQELSAGDRFEVLIRPPDAR